MFDIEIRVASEITRRACCKTQENPFSATKLRKNVI